MSSVPTGYQRGQSADSSGFTGVSPDAKVVAGPADGWQAESLSVEGSFAVAGNGGFPTVPEPPRSEAHERLLSREGAEARSQPRPKKKIEGSDTAA